MYFEIHKVTSHSLIDKSSIAQSHTESNNQLQEIYIVPKKCL
nr:MAG TPA: hypothetical protein [Caudoviricetes sp.]